MANENKVDYHADLIAKSLMLANTNRSFIRVRRQGGTASLESYQEDGDLASNYNPVRPDGSALMDGLVSVGLLPNGTGDLTINADEADVASPKVTMEPEYTGRAFPENNLITLGEYCMDYILNGVVPAP